jgi:hypothetical protein
LAAALERVNTALREDVAEFRRDVQAAGLELIPAFEPLTMDWRGER